MQRTIWRECLEIVAKCSNHYDSFKILVLAMFLPFSLMTSAVIIETKK